MFRQAEWVGRFPSLVQGITARLPDPDARTSLEAPEQHADAEGWELLQRAVAFERIVRCRQVHGSTVVVQNSPLPEGVNLVGEADAIISDRDDLLLVLTVADCVPVFFVEPNLRLLGLAHAGWRGTAAGVVEATLQAFEAQGSDLACLHVHLGPAICGKCYEVGPEVLEALGSEDVSAKTVDLRARIAEAAVFAGVDPGRLTVSTACTRCRSGEFYSYRGGDRGLRNVAFLGWPPG